jgi:hypothetical protein
VVWPGIRWRLGCVDLYVEQEVGPARENKKNRVGSAFALDAELGL